jgi:acyl carrier protein
MDKQTTILKIVQQISKKNVTPDPDESLFDLGLIDSFGLTTLVEELERQFGVKVPDDDLVPRKFESLNRIAEYLENRG